MHSHSTEAFRREIVYKKTANLVTRNIVDDTIIVPISGKLADMQSIFAVESVGAFIWEQINGTRTSKDIHRLILEEFDIEPQTAENDLEQFISELLSAGLIAAKAQKP